MRYGESRLYARALRAIADPRRLKAIHEAVERLVDCFETGSQPPTGLGLKKLRAPLWEVRSSLQDRILFSWEKDLIVFVVAGDHANIRRFLQR